MPPNPEPRPWPAPVGEPDEIPVIGHPGGNGGNGEMAEPWEHSGPPAIRSQVNGWPADPAGVGDYGGTQVDEGWSGDLGAATGGDWGHGEPAYEAHPSHDRQLGERDHFDRGQVDRGFGERDRFDRGQVDRGQVDRGQHDRGFGEREDDEREYDDYFDDDEDDIADVETTSNATRSALEWAVVLVGAVLVALLLRASLFQAFWIPSESMETTLLTNDRVLVNKVSYRLHEIHRGDIVVFARPDREPGEIRDLIKRVIALPGETIEAKDNAIYINGQRLVEPYLDPDSVTADFGPTVVPSGEIFVMGDNRSDSYDSRWFGTVSEERVVGRAFVLFWPLNRVGSL